MDLFPLTIFPEGGLAGSIITTVWVGVFVMCFFNLRYGWVLSGLVVPGYVVPLLIVKPLAAFVIGLEAVLAYLIVWLFSEKIAPGRFPSLFGRDRFMGLILASIAVRLTMDGFLLPEFSIWMEENFDRRIDWESNLQSFGLIVISLMANQFWKPGLGRGLIMAGVTIGLTYLIVRWGLMELTNFRISGVYYIYESLASSIHASPKAYIILTLTALIASHYNVKYGWDFSGVLIPALLALQWYQPTKILTSFGEAIVIYVIARMILQLPFMANVTMEGGRKLLLFFNISFAWKMAVGWVIIWQGYDVKTTDFFGFGYLLSTLIAIKAHDKDIFPRLARSTLQVSLVGAVLGNVAGFTLSAASSRAPWSDGVPQEGEAAQANTPAISGLVVRAVGDAYKRKMRDLAQPLSPSGRDDLANLVELLNEGLPLPIAQFEQRTNGWRIKEIAGGRLAIVRDDEKGSELLFFDPAASGDLAIILPDPTLRPGLATAALDIHSNQNARWLVVSAPQPGSGLSNDTVADIFINATNTAHIVIDAAPEGSTSQLAFADGSAASGDLTRLRQIIPDLKASLANESRAGQGTDATLRLSDEAITGIAKRRAGFATSRRLAPCQLSRHEDGTETWNSLSELAYARFEIAAPMIAKVKAGEAPYVASASGKIAGMELRPCLINSAPHWALSSSARDEGNIMLASGKEPQKALLTFENSRSDLPARIGARVHDKWQSDALFVATRSDSFLREPNTIFDVVWQEWVRAQEGVSDPMVLQLRARPREALRYRKSVDVLVANDRIGSPREGLSDIISALRNASLRAETITNSAEQAGMEARPGMSVRYLETAGDRSYAIGWLNFSGIGRRPAGEVEEQ
ncbi:MAG: poly-gamma-glutamate biosynthesis protein PgsC/CapC [Pseudomonadota bacterium]